MKIALLLLIGIVSADGGAAFNELKTEAASDGEGFSGKFYALRNAAAASNFARQLLEKCVSDDMFGKSLDVIVSIDGNGGIKEIWTSPDSPLTRCAKTIDVTYSQPPKTPFLMNFQITLKREGE